MRRFEPYRQHRVYRLLIGSLLLLLLGWAGGCSLFDTRQIQIESAAAQSAYESAALSYRLDAGRLNVPLELARIEGQQVSFASTPSNPSPDRSVAVLSIKYPHPEDRPGYALVEVVIENDPNQPAAAKPTSPWRRWIARMGRAARENLPGVRLDEGVQEAWAYDVPRSELDAILASLGRGGYFGPAGEAAPGVVLAAKIDGAAFHKNWRPVPELDALLRRARDEGELVSYVRPPGAAGPGEHSMTSAAAYRQAVGPQPWRTAPSGPFAPQSTLLASPYGAAAPAANFALAPDGAPRTVRLPPTGSWR